MSRSFVLVLLATVPLAGCATGLGRLALVPQHEPLPATKLLRPGAEGRSCRTSIFGVPTGAAGAPSLPDALEQVSALDPEGNALANVDVRWESLVTGVYNRRCIAVRGDLVRTIPTITIPVPGGHHHPH